MTGGPGRGRHYRIEEHRKGGTEGKGVGKNDKVLDRSRHEGPARNGPYRIRFVGRRVDPGVSADREDFSGTRTGEGSWSGGPEGEGRESWMDRVPFH